MKAFFFLILFPSFVFALENVKVDLYSEAGIQKPLTDSPYHKNDIIYSNSLRSYSRGAITFQSRVGGGVQATLKVDGTYRPVNFTRTSSITPSAEEEVKVKTAYLQYANDFIIFGMGKKFINWGGGAFFTPLDVINENRDPLRPLDEAEGSSQAYLGFPFGSSSMLEFYSVFRSDDSATKKADERLIDFIPRFAFSFKNLSSFIFCRVNKEDKNFLGLNLTYSFSPFQDASLTLLGEGAYKKGSERGVFLDDGRFETRDKAQYYQALLLGLQLQVGATKSSWIDGVSFVSEFFQNTENWSKNEYRNYLNHLPEASQLRTLLQSMIKPFQNGKEYLYSSFFLNSFSSIDVDIGIHHIFNLGDGSSLFIPEISYPIAKKQGALTLKSYLLSGKKNSEFGSSPYNYQTTLSFSYSF